MQRSARAPGWSLLLTMPIAALAVFGSAKSFRDNPVIGSPALNRRGLHVLRRRIAARIGAHRRRGLRGLISPSDLADFERDGFIVKRDFLDDAAFRALRDEIVSLEAPAREAVIGDTFVRLIPLDGRNLRKMPKTRAVLEGRAYRGLLDFVHSFRRRPHLYVQTIYSRYCEGEPDIQSFYHADTFHPTLKSWFYLDDVEEDAAPLSYVPGSHRLNHRRLAVERRMSLDARDAGDRLTAEGSLRFSDAQLRMMRYGAPRQLCVRANTLVVADTSGIHRRTPTTKRSVRLSIWAYSRSNPFLPWTRGDVAGLPLIRDHALRLYLSLKDRVKTARRVQREWHWVGRRSPLSAPPPDANF